MNNNSRRWYVLRNANGTVSHARLLRNGTTGDRLAEFATEREAVRFLASLDLHRLTRVSPEYPEDRVALSAEETDYILSW